MKTTAMKTQSNLIEELRNELDLSCRRVTGGNNDYPCLGEFYYDFKNFEEAEEFAAATGGSIATAHWRDGWYNCELKDAYYSGKGFEATAEWYGDNYQIIYNADDLKEEVYYRVNELINYGYDDNDDELIEAKRDAEKTLERCSDVDWTKERVVLCCGFFYEKIEKVMMSFYNDKHTTAIGVFIER